MEQIIPTPEPEPDPGEDISETLQAEFIGLFQVNGSEIHSRGQLIVFNGRLLLDPETGYARLQQRLQVHGYTPSLRREDGEDILLAMKGLPDQIKPGKPLINLLLFLATVFTMLSAGAGMVQRESLIDAILSGSLTATFQAISAGAPFAITLLGILSVHELGHYVASRAHGVGTSLPYFIPMPFGLGTLGAFISLRSPMPNRKILFDIGLAGPLAGFLVALPLLVAGILFSSVEYVYPSNHLQTLDSLGSSVLIRGAVALFTDIPAGRTMEVHPVYFAAWLGLFLTGINLLPVGQLDGGHAAYALLGRTAHVVAMVIFLALIVAGAFLSPNWFIWAFFIMLGGLRHPPPMNDISDIGLGRKLLFGLTVVLFLLIIVPTPFH